MAEVKRTTLNMQATKCEICGQWILYGDDCYAVSTKTAITVFHPKCFDDFVEKLNKATKKFADKVTGYEKGE